MKRLPLILAIALACAWPAAPTVAARTATPESAVVENVLVMPVDGDIAINADGSVRSYIVATEITPALKALLEGMVPKWRFELAANASEAKAVQARIRISLAATQTGTDYQVRIENVTFPQAASADEHLDRTGSFILKPGRMDPPIYPRALERAGVTGKVLLGLHIAPDGHVQQVVPVQVMLFNVRARDRTMEKAIEMLEENAVAAARRWTVKVEAQGATPASPEDFTAMTTVEYVLSTGRHIISDPADVREAKAAGKWQLVSRTPKRTMPWLEGIKDLPTVGVADVQAGEMVPLASSIRLKTEVAGTVLNAPAG